MKENIKTIIRWLAIIPVSIASFYAFGILAKLINHIEQFFFGTGIEKIDLILFRYILDPILSGLFAMGSAVVIGSLIAPEYRKHVAFVLLITIIVIEIRALYLINFVNGNYLNNLDALAGITGCIFGYFYVLEREKNKLKKTTYK